MSDAAQDMRSHQEATSAYAADAESPYCCERKAAAVGLVEVEPNRDRQKITEG